jgi:hypothetical protein
MAPKNNAQGSRRDAKARSTVGPKEGGRANTGTVIVARGTAMKAALTNGP